MQTTTINVRYVNPPKGKGPASVKDDKGVYWKFWTRDIPLERFVAGQTYNVGYRTEPYNGQDQYYIEVVMDGTAPAPAPAQQKPNGSAPASHAANGNGNGQRDEFIFVCGGLNQAIAAGKVELDTTSLVPRIEALRDAYRQTFGK